MSYMDDARKKAEKILGRRLSGGRPGPPLYVPAEPQDPEPGGGERKPDDG